MSASAALASSGEAAALGSSVAGAGGLTVRSLVFEGSVSTSWLGTAGGFAGWPRPPAAITAAPVGSAAAASSSQSISSSAAAAVLGLALAACSVSYCWRRAIRSAFLPVWGRERALRRSSSSAFFFLA